MKAVELNRIACFGFFKKKIMIANITMIIHDSYLNPAAMVIQNPESKKNKFELSS